MVGEEVVALDGAWVCGWDCFMARSAAEGENSELVWVEYVADGVKRCLRAMDVRMCDGEDSVSMGSSSSTTDTRDDEDTELSALTMGISLDNLVSIVRIIISSNVQSPSAT